MEHDPGVYDHYRLTDDDYHEGIYRVVGTPDDAATLLRVGDADGRRVNTGEVLTVDRAEMAAFESADNPDGNRSLAAVLAGVPKTIFWQLRAFVGSIAASPVPAAIGIALVLLGEFGERAVDLPNGLDAGLIVAGALVLAGVASGRL